MGWPRTGVWIGRKEGERGRKEAGEGVPFSSQLCLRKSAHFNYQHLEPAHSSEVAIWRRIPRGRWHVSDDVSRDVDPHSAARGRDCPFAMAAGEALCLYRAMQRSARKFTNYNVRECVLGRRVPSALPRAVGSEP